MGWNQKKGARSKRRGDVGVRARDSIGVQVGRCMMALAVAFLIVGMSTIGAETLAKSKVRLSQTKKTYLLTGVSDKLTLKNVPKSAKVRWKSSNPSVVRLGAGKKRTIWFKVKKTGKSTVTATYKGKKYRCSITIKDIEADASSGGVSTDKDKTYGVADEDDYDSADYDIWMNQSEASIYRYSEYDTYNKNDVEHPAEYHFSIEGTSEKPCKWKIVGDTVGVLSISDDGLVSVSETKSLPRGTKSEMVTVYGYIHKDVYTTATLTLYDDRNNYIDTVIQRFKDAYIREGMTEYEKMMAVVEYVAYEHDYELNQYNWEEFLLKGSGDCFASRFAVQNLAREVGLKAVGCPSDNAHGQTMVKADGQMYLVTTGFNMPRPGKYIVWEMTDEMMEFKVKQNSIDPDYFN